MPLPDFLVIGAPKAGTTALHAALARHPQLFLSHIKEPKFFLCGGDPPNPAEQRGPGDAHSAREWIWRRERYEELFAPAPPGALKGESTPFYLWDPRAHVRIRDVLPDVKLIAVIRDPVDRAHSNWAHLWSDGLEPIGNFMDAWAAESQRAERGWAPFWRYQGLGRYGEQLQQLYTVFPRTQVHLLRYRDLVDDPSATLDRVCNFLGVETGRLTMAPPENVTAFAADTPLNAGLRRLVRVGASAGAALPPKVWRQASRPVLAVLKRKPSLRPELDEQDRATLIADLADDIALLEQVTGERFQDWLHHRPGTSFLAQTSRDGLPRVAS